MYSECNNHKVIKIQLFLPVSKRKDTITFCIFMGMLGMRYKVSKIFN